MAAFGGMDDDGGSEPAPEPVEPPQSDEAPEQAHVPSTPEGEEQAAPPEAIQADEDSFTPLDPNQLPPELLPTYRQLMKGWTQKTQELAEQRRQFESLGTDMGTLEQAVQLHRTLSDPENWAVLHAELSREMEARGLTPAQADAAAAHALQDEPGFDPVDSDDPEIASLRHELRASREELNSVKGYLQHQAEIAAYEREQAARIGEHNRMLSAIRQSNPHYDNADTRMVEQMSSFFDGDLFQAQNSLEDYVMSRIEKYVGGKRQGAGNTSLLPAPGGDVLSEQHPEVETLEDAEQILLEALRNQLGD